MPRKGDFMKELILFFAVFAMLAMVAGPANSAVNLEVKAKDIDARLAQYAPVDIKVDLSSFNQNQIQVLRKMIEAAKYLGDIGIEQRYGKNLEYKKAMETAIANGKLDKKYLDYFMINSGPFDLLDDYKPFIGNDKRPDGANFYALNIKKEEIEKLIKDKPWLEDQIKSPVTVVKKDAKGEIYAVPYYQAYAKQLEPAAKLLWEASAEAGKFSDELSKYLRGLSLALYSNDYYKPDVDLVKMRETNIEPALGPVDGYSDDMFNVKGAFDATVSVVDPKDDAKLKMFVGNMENFDKNLPVEPAYKMHRTSYDTPLRVVNVVYMAVEPGAKAIAYSHPGDEWIKTNFGTKVVLLKNLMGAKFDTILTKIAEQVLSKDQLAYVSKEMFFNEILNHELGHGIGPINVVDASGKRTAVDIAKSLKEYGSALEEAKADTMSVYNMLYSIDKGLLKGDKVELEKQLFATYLAGIFRTIRFGTASAHGKGMLVQLNHLKENGAITITPEGIAINFEKARPAFKSIVEKIITIQAKGDYEGAKSLIEGAKGASSYVENFLKKIADANIPRDIKPNFAKI
jgi:hypothetical protein